MSDITILMPCFNKEKYIEKALNSIFEQKTRYSMEILIADDGSTDKTLEIIDIYKNKNIIPFKILKSEKNQGLFKNVTRAYNHITSPYFTVLDPDDYWCDIYKIENALTFLETHLDFTIYSSNIYVKTKTRTYKYFKDLKTMDFDFSDFLKGKAYVGQTSGTVFRNIIFKNGLPNKIQDLKEITKQSTFRGDSYRNLIHLHEGKCHYDPKCSSTYLITDDGIWTASTSIKRELLNINFYHDMFIYFEEKNIELLQQSYDLYRTFLKKFAKFSKLHEIQNDESLGSIFDNLKELCYYYKKYENSLLPKKDYKKRIMRPIIILIDILYNKVIYYTS